MIKTIARKHALALPLAALTLAVSSAYAAPVVGPADISFYDATPVAGGAHGDARRAGHRVVDLLDLERRRPRQRAWACRIWKTVPKA